MAYIVISPESRLALADLFGFTGGGTSHLPALGNVLVEKNGQVMPCHPSQFLKKLPPELIEHGDEKGKQPVTTESGKGLFAAMREMLD